MAKRHLIRDSAVDPARPRRIIARLRNGLRRERASHVALRFRKAARTALRAGKRLPRRPTRLPASGSPEGPSLLPISRERTCTQIPRWESFSTHSITLRRCALDICLRAIGCVTVSCFRRYARSSIFSRAATGGARSPSSTFPFQASLSSCETGCLPSRSRVGGMYWRRRLRSRRRASFGARCRSNGLQ